MFDYGSLADRSLAGEVLTLPECHRILSSVDDDLLALLQAAFTVRRRHFGRRVRLHMLINAKSGLCPEDCGYCSQSKRSTAPIDRYPLLPADELLAGAERAVQARARRFCIVTSGRGPTPREVAEIGTVASEIKRRYPLELCCSLGLLTPSDAQALKTAGVDRINHNLNTSERFYPQICATHSYQDRLETLRNARDAGLEVCSGGIVGMGESPDDLIEMGLAFRRENVDSIPVNFLHPVEGTPLAGAASLSPGDCLRALCLMRFLNPATEIRIAGGREHNLRSMQPLALYPANALFVGGYLTTPGQAPGEAWRMIEDWGFEIETVASEAAAR